MAEEARGCVMWFTGVPAAGKSTVAKVVEEKLRARDIKVENLDADEWRARMSPDLKYTQADMDLNTKRLAYVGKLISRHGVCVIIAAVAPMREYRDRARDWIENFVEVFVDCPTEVCKQRDPKGLYAKGDKGIVNDIPGVHVPYEEPKNPEVHLRTDKLSVEQAADQVLSKLEELGYIPVSYGVMDDEDEVYSEEEEEKIKERLRGLGYL
jgi:adenylyl-sulfate kinase